MNGKAFIADKNSGWYGNFKLPLIYNEEIENYIYCFLTADILLRKQLCSSSGPIPNIFIVETLHLIGCNDNLKDKFAKHKQNQLVSIYLFQTDLFHLKFMITAMTLILI